MKKSMSSFLKRILAAELTLFMVFTSMPLPVVTYAETGGDENPIVENNNQAVEVIVKDTDENPIADATVKYIVSAEQPSADSEEWKEVAGVTDESGKLTVLEANTENIPTDIDSEVFIWLTVSAFGYNTNTTDDTTKVQLVEYVDENTLITAPVTLEKKQLLMGVEETYTGEEVSAAERNDTFLTEIKTKYGEDISVKYALQTSAGSELTDSDWDDEIPTIKNADTYTVWVKVVQTVDSQENIVWEERVSSVINKAKKEGLGINAVENLVYTGESHDLVTLTGSNLLNEADSYKWYVNDEEYILSEGDEVPKADIPGVYTVKLIANYGSNYEELEITASVKIENGLLDTTGISVEGYSGIYDDEEHEAVILTPADVTDSTYTLMYQLHECTSQECTHECQEDDWTTEIPKVEDAGSYIVWVKAIQEHYDDKEIDVTAGADAVEPFNVYIAKKQHELSFVDENAAYENNGSKTEILKGIDSFTNLIYNFGVANENDTSEGIVYSVQEQTATETFANTEKATIDANGILTVNDAGTYVVSAVLAGDDNHGEGKITYTLTVGVEPKNVGDFVVFKDTDDTQVEQIDYVLGTNAGVISELSASKMNANDNATISYDIDKKEIGISCEQQGKITVTDYEKLAQELVNSEDGTVEVIVTATKVADKDWKDDIRYQADSTSYKIIIKFAETPEVLYSLSESTGENDWYKAGDTVEVYAPENYTISKTATDFSSSVIFDDEGAIERYIYLQKSENGEITAPIKVVDENNENLKIDTQKPDAQNMEIVFSGLNIVEKLGNQFGFFQAPVTITFYIEDEVNAEESGIDYITWTYLKDSQATSSIIGNMKDNQLSVVKNGNEYIATLTLPAVQAGQLRGNLSFTATDKAGNTSELNANSTIVVVDSIDSILFVEHELADDGNYNPIGEQQTYSNDVKFTFEINEANFFTDDVQIDITKDGNPYACEVTWEHDDEMHYGTLILSEEGDYIVSADYQDNSGNKLIYKDIDEITAYTSEPITIDKTAPKLDFAYDKSTQKMTFTVTEHNFRAQDISLSGTITDINDNIIKNFSVEQLENMLRSANWTAKGNDVYTCSFDSCPDGIYNLSINYKDIVLQDATTVNTGAFIIDHTAPTNIKIDYSKSLLDTILETVTLGFYKGDVTVTFTANDYAAGVESFTWNYTKQNGASDVNRSTDEVPTTVAAVQDISDKSKFTAKVTLPNTDEKQLRGYLAAYATDTYANIGTKVTDSGQIIVLDSIAPTMTAEYSVADRMVGNTSYYNDLAEVTFTVTEANFFAEEVVVTVSKDGGTAYAVTPNWTDVNVDTHVGAYTLTGDGDYVITVNYTDRSTNKMATYVSNTITIDTIQPVVEVVYQNTNVINTLKDSDGMDREYFADTQTAIVTITEHNFNTEDVVFNIKATDVTGEELNVNNLHVKSEWKVGEKADTYVMTITYPGDANYTFDVEYADMATNKIADYATDYFTVDNTAPVELNLTYSTSVLETILEALSFGFYNAKADVTLTADDAVSGVHGFIYSYENADGVSDVNAELINQAIVASEIEYSNEGNTIKPT